MDDLLYLDPPKSQTGRVWLRVVLPVGLAVAALLYVAWSAFRIGAPSDRIGVGLLTVLIIGTSLVWSVDEWRKLRIVPTREGLRIGGAPVIPWRIGALEPAKNGIRFVTFDKRVLISKSYFNAGDFWAFFTVVDQALAIDGMRRATKARILTTPAYVLSDADLSDYLKHVYAPSWQGFSRVIGTVLTDAVVTVPFVYIAWWFLVTKIFPAVPGPLSGHGLMAVGAVSLVLSCGSFVTGTPARRRRVRAILKKIPIFHDPHAVSVCAAGIIHSDDYYDSYMSWLLVSKVVDLPNIILITQARGASLIIPKRIFLNPDAAGEFYALAQSCHRAAFRGTAEIIPIR